MKRLHQPFGVLLVDQMSFKKSHCIPLMLITHITEKLIEITPKLIAPILVF